MGALVLAKVSGSAVRRLGVGALVAVLAVALVALLAPSAEAVLVPQKSIMGVKLGQTRQQVIDRLGEPDKTVKKSHPLGGSYFELRYGRTSFLAWRDVEGALGTVFAMVTKSAKERTEDNVGVGSSEKKLRDRVKGVSCETESRRRFCMIGALRPGKVVTTFWLNSERRIYRIQISYVID